MSDFLAELRKVPPVTRFLCASSLAVTLPTMLQLVSPYKVVFIRAFVTKKWEFWRIYTSFFLGSSGINYIFDFAMLYRTTNELELKYGGRSADFAWQTILAAIAIIAFNLPLQSAVHARPLLVALTYLSSRLAPPGTQSSLMGLLTFPVIYYPYALIAMDLVMGGPSAAASSLTGILVGHLWWWGVWESRALQNYAQAPLWLKGFVDNETGPTVPPGSGVHVIPPRARQQRQEGNGSGYNWGSGHRLGTD